MVSLTAHTTHYYIIMDYDARIKKIENFDPEVSLFSPFLVKNFRWCHTDVHTVFYHASFFRAER